MRAVSASAKHIQAIEKLKHNGKLYKLSDEIQTTAELRLENPDMPLIELARLHNPPITKSGLNHRISKIMDLAKKNDLI